MGVGVGVGDEGVILERRVGWVDVDVDDSISGFHSVIHLQSES